VVRIAILSDAHLLMQAEWLSDERQLTSEGREVLDNFRRVMNQVEKKKPDAVILAGDVFDWRTKGWRRVAHREGEKYMVEIRAILEHLADDAECKIYALKGNHDSEPVLMSTEKILKGKFIYTSNKPIEIGDLSVFLMDSHYVQGPYEIPLESPLKKHNLLVMHESAQIFGTPAPPKETFRKLCKSADFAFNGHMHLFQPEAMGIPNLWMVPALIPTREIKGNWVLRYRYPGDLKPDVRETPFGYILLENGRVEFQPYEPLQVVVRVEINGDKTEDYQEGVAAVYDILSKRRERGNYRVWVVTDADPVMINRILWPSVMEYEEVKTLDILRSRKVLKPQVAAAEPKVEFGDKAFTRQELIERVLGALREKDRKIARKIFDEILTKEFLTGSRLDEPTAFKRLLEIISEHYEVSDGFVKRAWELAKGRVED